MITRKLGIDLGTTNTLVFVPGKGLMINEPTVVALSKPGNTVMAVGLEAKEMVGRTPGDIVTYRPLKDGVIAEYYTTKTMLEYFISKAVGRFNIFKPEVVISVSAGITSTEKRAVMNAAREAGAKEVYLVREPLLAALGANIPINSSSGNMIINMGGGTCEVAVISLGGIVTWSSRRVAGNHFDQAIMDYIKKKYVLAIGENTAENIKIEIGAALTNPNKLTMKIRGRDLITGLPRDLIINSNEIVEAIDPYLNDIVASVQSVFNVTPPELVADIMEKGIIVSGGTAQLRHIDEFFRRHLGVAAYVAEDPFYCVAKGTAVILEHLDVYKRTLLSKL
ncbi:rod shape-determining protein [Candidatus Jorgensenbacteria bacterium RIFCSPLOWO2_12_FULL_42_11]|uniref:Cell shape-determining protein MreB n=1 Tax=Candidatus Jorgensenbacteria bacterium RIFCSPLOWO2_12_FULL_42_11 TaxID=1798473 RepID=A0A1F6C2T9_9BACT|nr:MAG: rod shape-determining protein [Candidatus Jorgensenbacteria bacterium RIFCSPLOWO2_12_FULL_42_11]